MISYQSSEKREGNQEDNELPKRHLRGQDRVKGCTRAKLITILAEKLNNFNSKGRD